MGFSQKSKEQMDSCRFCWMCRHICPIGNATGQERNTARARALGLSLVARDAVEYSEDIINNVYECALCGACVHDCATGWDPVLFTKEARLVAALEGKLPSYINDMLDNIENTGNIYGKAENGFAAKYAKNHTSGDTLFFIGKDARINAPEKAEAAIALLEKAGADFAVLESEPDSGYAYDFLIGAAAETKDTMTAAAKALSSYKKIVCYDPADAKMFKREYKEWDIALSAQIVTFTEFVAELIKNGSLKVKKSNKAYTIQDSAILARDLEETEPIREIISSLGENREMLLFGKETVLAGNLIMNEYMPEVMADVAKNRWINAKNMNAETVVTTGIADYVIMNMTKPEGMELLTVEEAVEQCL